MKQVKYGFVKKTIFFVCVIFCLVGSHADEPQQITTCVNQYYLDYYTKLAEEVNRIYAIQYGGNGSNLLCCPGYFGPRSVQLGGGQ